MQRVTIEQLRTMRESEDHVEFKKGEGGNVSYNGAGKDRPKERRRCILGYVVALCNEGGGYLVIGMHDAYPHQVTGTLQSKDAIGELESAIYRDLSIRPEVYELYDEDCRRVLVIQVPGRPVGKVYKFEDVALMRVGEELLPMDDKTYISIIQEQEPDFSGQICEYAGIESLDDEAIDILKDKYALKQHNPAFRSLTKEQALNDLGLLRDGKVTNAAVLLVGKEAVLNDLFPQAKVMLEYRNSEAQIHFDNRTVFGQPFFRLIDELWASINVHNGSVPIRDGAYIYDIPFFNENVIREIVNNAFAHRDYRRNSEIVIKLYPAGMEIINAGGFPQGVSLDNLLSVPSTPRNRLLADVLAKTGVVERSGQGVDKIFHYTLAEGKSAPDYSRTDDFNVTAVLSANVKDAGFALFIQTVQKELDDAEKLSVFDIMALCQIRDGDHAAVDKRMLRRLEARNCVEKHGKTQAQYYTLPRRYYELAGRIADYSRLTDWDARQVLAVLAPYLQKYGKAKKSEIWKIVGSHVTDKQLRNFLGQLKAFGFIKTEGERGQMIYMLGDKYIKSNELVAKALDVGLKALRDKGELSGK